MSMKQQAEINRLQEELDALTEEMERLSARLEVIEKEKAEKRGPGRPKKNG